MPTVYVWFFRVARNLGVMDLIIATSYLSLDAKLAFFPLGEESAASPLCAAHMEKCAP